MDYEKKYKDAVARMDLCVRTGLKITPEYIFPEFKESEDERMCKRCIDLLRKVSAYSGEEYLGVEIADCIIGLQALMKKQKAPNARQRLAEWSKTEEGKAKYEEVAKEMREEIKKEHQFYSDAPKEKSVGGDFLSSHKDKNLDEIAQDYVEGVKEYNPEPTWDLMQTAVCYGYHLAEQKEQKPREIEWEDAETLAYIRDILKKYFLRSEEFEDIDRWLTEHYVEQKPAEWNDFEIHLMDCMLAAQQYRQGSIDLDIVKPWAEELSELIEQPKKEWDEFDEDCLKRAIWYVENPAPSVVKDTNLALWLKSLRPQPIKLKEAYKDGFQTARHATALTFMNYCDKIRPNGKMCLSNGECEEIEKAFLIGDWEKIERYFHKYQWRPSKEQMEALKKEADKYWEVDGVDPLYTLWQDLQKLQNQGRGG